MCLRIFLKLYVASRTILELLTSLTLMDFKVVLELFIHLYVFINFSKISVFSILLPIFFLILVFFICQTFKIIFFIMTPIFCYILYTWFYSFTRLKKSMWYFCNTIVLVNLILLSVFVARAISEAFMPFCGHLAVLKPIE